VKTAPADSCWVGDTMPSACCDLSKSMRGDPNCWDDLFSFELCCPNEVAQIAKAVEDSCWLGVIQPKVCCDLSKGAKGDRGCWGDIYNFDSCCTQKVFKELETERIRETCWIGEITHETCCDIRKGPRGDPGCWNGPYTFPTCCPTEARLLGDFAASCWVGVFTASVCCDPFKGPRGDETCWRDIFTFETCCPNELVAQLGLA